MRRSSPAVVSARILRTWGLYEPSPELDEGVHRFDAALTALERAKAG